MRLTQEVGWSYALHVTESTGRMDIDLFRTQCVISVSSLPVDEGVALPPLPPKHN